MKKKQIVFISIGIILISTFVYVYKAFFTPQVTQDTVIYIKSTDKIEDVYLNLDSICKNTRQIKFFAKLRNYQNPKPGKYLIESGKNAFQIVNMLRSGRQVPIKVTFNNQTYIEELAGRLAQQVEADSTQILKTLTDETFLKKYDLNSKSAIQLYMPYTYECYWSIKPEDLREKLADAYVTFWSKDNIAKAKTQGLTPVTAVTLASIVQKESAYKPERPIIAGVYLNRLKIGMPLQADPTVIYAVKEVKGRDFTIKRVIGSDLRMSSPYNTYLNTGLPPHAIAMPDIDAIEAVLNPSKHNYLYFCASPKKIGTHDFASNFNDHTKYARAYQQWLNNQKVHR